MNIFEDKIGFDQLAGEVKTLLKKYEDSGHVSDSNIIMFIMDRLKIFGNNVMVDYEDVIPISDFRGMLPSNLYRVNAMFRCRQCEPIKKPCEPCSECGVDDPEDCKPRPYPTAQKMFKWVETNKYRETLTDCDVCEPEIQTTVGCEITYVPEVAKFELRGRIPLSYGKGMMSGMCTDACKGYHDHQSKYQVEIVNKRMLKTSFPEGSIYVQYYGIPLDENNRPMIQNSNKGYVYEHIKYYVVTKILEYIIIENERAIPIYNLMRQNMMETERKAIVDSKVSTFSNESYIRMHARNRLNTEQYFKTRPGANYQVSSSVGKARQGYRKF